MNIKPIFTVGLPKCANLSDIETLNNKISEKMNDYHVLIYVSNSDGYIFEVFYEKDFNQVKFDELKKIIKNSLNKNELEIEKN